MRGFCLAYFIICLSASASSPSLFITGLPCPGNQNEPTNGHPLVWQCRSAYDQNNFHSWGNWQNTIPIDYGDVVNATWFDECKLHPAAWNFLQIQLVFTNQAGAWYTNTSTWKMKAGYNFALGYVYWYTNNGLLYPTNFDVAQTAVALGSYHLTALSLPASVQGTFINPPLWQGGTNPITNPANWPMWGGLPDHFPFWPPWITNNDGVMVISPSAQQPICNLQPLPNQSIVTVQGLPGPYSLQTKARLTDAWSASSNLIAGADGSASVSLPLQPPTNLFVRAAATSPSVGLGYLAKFTTTGDLFEPVISFDNGDPQQFLWQWSDSTTSANYPLASKNFGFPATRTQSLKVTPANSITAINLGFDASDGGENTPLDNRPFQDVSAVEFPYPLVGLRYWASSYNPLTSLNFSDFTALQIVECFHCSNLQSVAVANLPSLRRVCFEDCDLQELDLTGNPNLEDVRAALNSFTEVKVGRGTGPKIWHWCIRDNPQITQDFQQIMTNFYALQEPWIWNDNQSGALSFVSTNLTDVEIQGNYYTSANLNHQANLQFFWADDNELTNVVLTGCVNLLEIRLPRNQLPATILDQILADADSAPNIHLVDISQNAEFPTAIGYSHYANLTNRGVNVYVDFPDPSGPIIALDSTTITAESCGPGNNAVDPGETVTVSFGLRNVGGTGTVNVIASLREANGIVSPSAPQNYGALAAGGNAVVRSYSFAAAGACGSVIYALFDLYDGPTYLGTAAAQFILGQSAQAFAEDFDGNSTPDLPPAWSSSATGGQSPWTIVSAFSDTQPNSAYASDPADPGISDLVSPPITLPMAPAQLSFRSIYDLEPDQGNSADDGGVLEIQIGTNAFTDILSAGGTFASFGYNRTITNIYANPLAGRLCWSGDSGGYTTTVVNLPQAAQGQTVQLRWRCATDSGNGQSYNGWQIDSIAITTPQCCSGQ